MGGCLSNSFSTLPYDPDHVDLKHFDILRVVGQGGFGKVNAAIKISKSSGSVDKGDDKDKIFAIKTMDKRMILDEHCLNLLYGEMCVLLDLYLAQSDFICNLKYVFHDNEHIYIALDFMPGGDLRYRLKNANDSKDNKNAKASGKFDIKTATFYLASVLEGLEAMHNRNILFRDLKPENLLLDAKGYVKLTDFGISHKLFVDSSDSSDSNSEAVKNVDNDNVVVSDSTVTGAGDVSVKPSSYSFTSKKRSGTHGYMAPECYLKPYEHGVLSDYYSLGIVAFEFLVGERPYEPNLWRDCVEKTGSTDKGELYFTEGKKLSNAPLLKITGQGTGIAKKFIQGLLTMNPKHRLGSKAYIRELKEHALFKDFSFDDLRNGRTTAPFIPDVSGSNSEMHGDDINLFADDDKVVKPLSNDQEALFDCFEFNHLLFSTDDNDKMNELNLKILDLGKKF